MVVGSLSTQYSFLYTVCKCIPDGNRLNNTDNSLFQFTPQRTSHSPSQPPHPLHQPPLLLPSKTHPHPPIKSTILSRRIPTHRKERPHTNSHPKPPQRKLTRAQWLRQPHPHIVPPNGAPRVGIQPSQRSPKWDKMLAQGVHYQMVPSRVRGPQDIRHERVDRPLREQLGDDGGRCLRWGAT